MSKLTHRHLIEAALVLAVLAVVWISLSVAEIRQMVPPEGVDSLDQFAEIMPPPTRIAIVEDAGAPYVVWIGEVGSVSLPSGHSCYVFDQEGHLVEWAWETGDGQRVTRFVRPAWEAESLTVHEAKQFIYGT